MLDVAIVGAGPVGLLLGALLLQEGLSVRILEQRPERSTHSRAIGIHPPGLAALARVGIAEALTGDGVRITRGLASSGGNPIAGLRFDRLGATHPFILAVPQTRTEELLETRVAGLDPGAVVRGCKVESMHDAGSFVTLTAAPTAGAGPGGNGETFSARLVVGADGARSTVRAELGIAAHGRDYPDTYLMGDFPDTGTDGSAAVLYLEPGGIVESFPLPGHLRRWVVHTDALLDGATAGDLAELIRDRTDARVEEDANSMLSAFRVRSRMASRMLSGRAVLVGDAAHEISPIGGQGMNLGWLDAAALAPIMTAALRGEATGLRLQQFEKTRMAAARRAARQAEVNMVLGRPLPASFLNARNTVLGSLVGMRPLQDLVARRFTMSHLR